MTTADLLYVFLFPVGSVVTGLLVFWWTGRSEKPRHPAQ